ncbi:MAG: exopolysaccharide biosynthesis polyprenyl glycosylphosphotransferase [Verrucomicrobiales bacterium]
MPIDHRSQKHWTHVCRHLLIDIGLVAVAFALATSVRFERWLPPRLIDYMPAIWLAAGAVGVVLYIAGLYSLYAQRKNRFVRSSLIIAAISVGMLVILGYGSIDYSARIGRGVLLISLPFIVTLVFAHHQYLFSIGGRFRERMACLACQELHEQEAQLIAGVDQHHTEFVGMITVAGYSLVNRDHWLGDLEDAEAVIKKHQISCVLCPPGTLDSSAAISQIRRLRYSGVTVFSLADICEEFFQAVPLRLVTPDWLLHCSGQPRLFYVRKLKRSFDILASLFFLALFVPLLVLCMSAVKLTSRGPAFYRQKRCGRFGRQFDIVKLRTMRMDAEEDGPRWSPANDDRLTPIGSILRRFRLDEIPQLWMVLKGDMSFVGPRPERQEFIDQLSIDIPCFTERVMVQPGITGWAQVNYPYGFTIEDSKRKLEYDLYYMKHMGLLLDCFVLLDTVRTVFLGGARKQPGVILGEFSNSLHQAFEGRGIEDLGA